MNMLRGRRFSFELVLYVNQSNEIWYVLNDHHSITVYLRFTSRTPRDSLILFLPCLDRINSRLAPPSRNI